MDDTPSADVAPGTQAWLDSVREDIIDAQTPVIDAHHHLWPDGGAARYRLGELTADLDTGHRVITTVFVECGAGYRRTGPDHLRSVGETEFVAGEAARSTRPIIGGIVAHADLADPEHLADSLDAHLDAGDGRLRGIRHSGSRAVEPEGMMIPGRAPEGLYADPTFRAGVAELGRRGLTYDTWHYHYQNREFLDLARAVPDTVMVLDHFGTPIGVGSYAGRREEIFEQWKLDVAEVARCDNVVAKLGGLAMPDNGFGWNTASRPPSSDEFIELQGPYYRHMIECFGPERCMFESNFPVDRFSLSYPVLWNAFKKLVADLGADEQDAMLRSTAARVYRLDV